MAPPVFVIGFRTGRASYAVEGGDDVALVDLHLLEVTGLDGEVTRLALTPGALELLERACARLHAEASP